MKEALTMNKKIIPVAFFLLALIAVGCGKTDVESVSANEYVSASSANSDSQPPVIEGLKDMTIYVRQAVAFKRGVVVTDNCSEEITLEINADELNREEPGTYPVTYTATDEAGNKTVQTITVTVIPRDYSEENVWKYADEALATIIRDGMNQRTKAEIIYEYVKRNLTYYVGHSVKDSWQQGAVDAFIDGVGDCYMFACMSRALLTRAGIPNEEVVRMDDGRPTTHYWNLVNVDDIGWLHFDTTPVKERIDFFLWTETQIEEYDMEHKGYHAYDKALYPTVNRE